MNKHKYIYTNQDGRQVELVRPHSIEELVIKLKETQNQNQLKYEEELRQKRKRTNTFELN